VELAWSKYPESYAGGSVTAGRASHVRQVKNDGSERRNTLVLQVAGLGVGLTTPLHKKCSVEKFIKLEN
jgi:hypothetical protein